MRRLFIPIILCCLLMPSQAQNLRTFLNYTCFSTDKNQPYLEFSMYIDGKSVVYKELPNHKYEAEVQILIKVFEKDSLIRKINYILTSPQYDDSLMSLKNDFADTKNLPLPNGKYQLEFAFRDMNTTTQAKPVIYTDEIHINYTPNKIYFSGIQLLKSFNHATENNSLAKYGLELIQKLDNYYPENNSKLNFYTEYYNTDKFSDQPLWLNAYVETYESSTMIPNLHLKQQLKPMSVGIVIHQFNIENLPSGNYNLILEIQDSNHTVLASNNSFFQRNNPQKDIVLDNYKYVEYQHTFVDNIKDSTVLREYIHSCFPIATIIEEKFFKVNAKKITAENMKKFFYTFWVNRAPNNPEQAWKVYKSKVDYVQKEYGSKQIKGYRTDRGRIYLKYGPPNEIISEPYDPNAYPYEMWFYYTFAENQTNIKFVFWNRDYVTNEYEILHSNARGEVNNPYWLKNLNSKLSPQINADDTSVESYFGGNAYEHWMQYK